MFLCRRCRIIFFSLFGIPLDWVCFFEMFFSADFQVLSGLLAVVDFELPCLCLCLCLCLCVCVRACGYVGVFHKTVVSFQFHNLFVCSMNQRFGRKNKRRVSSISFLISFELKRILEQNQNVYHWPFMVDILSIFL